MGLMTMADYKLDEDFEMNPDKTYCSNTKKTVIFWGFPIIFWVVVGLQSFIFLLQLFVPLINFIGLSKFIFIMVVQVVVVRFCMRKRITIFGLFGFLLRKRSAVYYPTPRSKRHTRSMLKGKDY